MIHKLILGALLVLSLLVLSSCGTQQVGATGAQATATPLPPTPKGPPTDIPIYPGATLQQQHSASFNGMMMDSWTYTVSGPNVAASDVINFYENQMPTTGWTPMQPMPPKNAKGAAVLIYQMQQPMMGTPGPGHGHMQRMAMIAVGANNQANPPQIGLVITEMR